MPGNRLKQFAMVLGSASILVAVPVLAQEHQQQVEEESTTTEWCYYNHHPTTGKIAKYCEVTITTGSVTIEYGYWKTDGTELMYA